MPVPKSYLDGEMPYGTTPVTINGNTYIVKSFTPDNPIAEVTDEGSVGEDTRSRAVRKQRAFSAELQLATGSTVLPHFADSFSYVTDPNYGTEYWVVQTAVAARSSAAGDIRTCTITGKSIINGSSVTAVS